MKKTYTTALKRFYIATTAGIGGGGEDGGAFTWPETVCGAFPSVIDAELHLALNADDVDAVHRVRDADGKLVHQWRTPGGGRWQLEAERAKATLVTLLRGDGPAAARVSGPFHTIGADELAHPEPLLKHDLD